MAGPDLEILQVIAVGENLASVDEFLQLWSYLEVLIDQLSEFLDVEAFGHVQLDDFAEGVSDLYLHGSEPGVSPCPMEVIQVSQIEVSKFSQVSRQMHSKKGIESRFGDNCLLL